MAQPAARLTSFCLEMAAAAEGADVDPGVWNAGPAFLRYGTDSLAVGAGKLGGVRGQDGPEGEAAAAALGADPHEGIRPERPL